MNSVKNKTFFNSVKCAFRGVLSAWSTERNFLLYIFHVAITFIINFMLRLPMWMWCVYGLTVAGVFSAELINTAIEKLCDLITLEHNEQIGFIKNVAAGAVLIWGVAFYCMEALFIWVCVYV